MTKKAIVEKHFFLGRRLVTWTSKKQTCTTQSIVEVEYVATAINFTNIVWIKHLLKGMKEEIKKTYNSLF